MINKLPDFNMGGLLGGKLGSGIDKIMQKAAPNEVKLKMTSIGEVMINGLPFTFGVESAGKATTKGICVTVSGEAVDSGAVSFCDFYLIEGAGKPRKTDFPLITKKDGKRIYQLRLEGINLPEAGSVQVGKDDKMGFLQAMSTGVSFRVTPRYSSGEDNDDIPEVMISVYPFENPLTGSATEWVNVTDDEDYFLHQLGKKKRKGFRKGR